MVKPVKVIDRKSIGAQVYRKIIPNSKPQHVTLPQLIQTPETTIAGSSPRRFPPEPLKRHLTHNDHLHNIQM